MYSLPTLSSFVSETEEEKDGTAPNEISRTWGILAAKAANTNIKKDCPKGGIHLQRLAWDATVTPRFPNIK